MVTPSLRTFAHASAAIRAGSSASRSVVRDLLNLGICAGGVAAILGLHMAVFLRQLDGEPALQQATKFALSFALLFLTYAWFASALAIETQKGRLLRAVTWITATAFVVEVGYILIRALMGERAHFNETTAFAEAMFAIMGVGAYALLAAMLLMAVATWRDRHTSGPRPLGLLKPDRPAIIIGLVLSAILTGLVGEAIVENGGPFVWDGDPGQLPGWSGTVPLLGWALHIGDLRPAHFLALHAMQVIPLLGLVSRGNLPALGGGAMIYAALTLLVLEQAEAGRGLLVP